MFNIGDYIIYSNTGVCKVEDICKPDGIDTDKLYYKLTPVYKPETVYIPVDSPVYMRNILTKQEALDFISRIPEISGDNESVGLAQKDLGEHYKTKMNSHECEDLVQIIKTIYSKEHTLHESGKKLIKTDADYKQKAETLLHGELSIALGIDISEVESFIENTINNLK